jgi:hypothetical protein
VIGTPLSFRSIRPTLELHPISGKPVQYKLKLTAVGLPGSLSTRGRPICPSRAERSAASMDQLRNKLGCDRADTARLMSVHEGAATENHQRRSVLRLNGSRDSEFLMLLRSAPFRAAARTIGVDTSRAGATVRRSISVDVASRGVVVGAARLLPILIDDRDTADAESPITINRWRIVWISRKVPPLRRKGRRGPIAKACRRKPLCSSSSGGFFWLLM